MISKKKTISLILLSSISISMTSYSELFKPFSLDNITTINPTKISTKITSGVDADFDDFPFYSRIVLYKMNENESISFGQICGSSIINESFILTAAHCVDEETINYYENNGYELRVIINDGNYWSGSEYYYKMRDETIPIKNIYSYPGYNSPLYANDIAIIELKNEITENFTSIELPTEEDVSYYENLESYSVTGMGKTLENCEEDDNCLPEYIQTAKMKKEDDLYCSVMLSFAGIDYPDIGSGMCVSPIDNTNVCKGDSGGPLTFLNEEGLEQQIGITSYGAATCEDAGIVPSVFTEIYYYNEWINNVITNGINEEIPELIWVEEEEEKLEDEEIEQEEEQEEQEVNDSNSGSFGLFGFLILFIFGYKRKIKS